MTGANENTQSWNIFKIGFQIHTQENICVALKQPQTMVTGTPTKITNMKYTMS